MTTQRTTPTFQSSDMQAAVNRMMSEAADELGFEQGYRILRDAGRVAVIEGDSDTNQVCVIKLGDHADSRPQFEMLDTCWLARGIDDPDEIGFIAYQGERVIMLGREFADDGSDVETLDGRVSFTTLDGDHELSQTPIEPSMTERGKQLHIIEQEMRELVIEMRNTPRSRRGTINERLDLLRSRRAVLDALMTAYVNKLIAA